MTKNKIHDTSFQSVDISIQNVDEAERHKTKNKYKIKKANKQLEFHLCLCTRLTSALNCQKSICHCMTNDLCAFSCYCVLLMVLLIMIALATIGYLTYLILMLRVNNSYFTPCQKTSDCNLQLGLYCPILNATCNCPSRNTYGLCDCKSGYYWNGTSCTSLLNYQDTGCVYDYNCDRSKNLVCSYGTCVCKNGLIYSSNSKSCTYLYVGCVNDNSGTFIFGTVNSVVINYFIDVCSDYCINLGIKYAHFRVNTGQNACICSNSVASSFSTNCDVLCTNLDGRLYYCGTSNTNNWRSVYQVL